MATKTVKLTGIEIKARRAAADLKAGYGTGERALIGGKTAEVVARESLDYLLVGDLDAAKSRLNALIKRERAARWTFHPDA